jgi:hypothetical protein
LKDHLFCRTGPVSLVFLLATLRIQGQEAASMVKFTPSFRFTDGIYLNVQQLKSNNPVPKKDLLIAEDYNDLAFFRKILSVRKINYTNEAGSGSVIEKDKVIGFSAGGILNLMHHGLFSSEVLIGSISFFRTDRSLVFPEYAVNENVKKLPYGDRYYFGSQPGALNVKITYGASDCFLMDYSSGKILRFNTVNLNGLLASDKELHDEFNSLARKIKKAQMFYFIGKFNEKNPLYLPLK